MTQDWILALLGGGLIGLSATILLLVNGRVIGISGIFYGVIRPVKNDFWWRAGLIGGLLVGGLLASFFILAPFANLTHRSLATTIVAGLFVGFGTRLGSGCTSGHGVCGISRLSARSLVATLSFIGAGVLVVTLVAKIFGGAI